jgi:hypothetical protein
VLGLHFLVARPAEELTLGQLLHESLPCPVVVDRSTDLDGLAGPFDMVELQVLGRAALHTDSPEMGRSLLSAVEPVGPLILAAIPHGFSVPGTV